MPETLLYAILSAAENAWVQWRDRRNQQLTPDEERKLFMAFMITNTHQIHPAHWADFGKDFS